MREDPTLAWSTRTHTIADVPTRSCCTRVEICAHILTTSTIHTRIYNTRTYWKIQFLESTRRFASERRNVCRLPSIDKVTFEEIETISLAFQRREKDLRRSRMVKKDRHKGSRWNETTKRRKNTSPSLFPAAAENGQKNTDARSLTKAENRRVRLRPRRSRCTRTRRRARRPFRKEAGLRLGEARGRC